MRLPSPISPSALFPTLWPWAKRLISTLVAGLFIVTNLVGWATPAQAQAGLAPPQPVTVLTVVNQLPAASASPNTPYANPCDIGGCAGANVNLTFGAGSNRTLDGFQTAATPGILRRATGFNERVALRRNPLIDIGGNVATTRDILFYESTSFVGNNPPTAINLSPEQATDIEATLLSPIVNRGIDNVFHNQFNFAAGDSANQDTRSNIERIDYILRDGVVVPPELQGQEGFLVLERNGNDPFGIAAITSLNANGDPTSYGPWFRWGWRAGATLIMSGSLPSCFAGRMTEHHCVRPTPWVIKMSEEFSSRLPPCFPLTSGTGASMAIP